MIFPGQIKNLWNTFREKGFWKGNTAQSDTYTGFYGEVSIDMERKVLKLHDGVTVGGAAEIISATGGGSGLGTASTRNVGLDSSEIPLNSNLGTAAYVNVEDIVPSGLGTAATKDFGTELTQIPLNSNLGSAAYVNVEDIVPTNLGSAAYVDVGIEPTQIPLRSDFSDAAFTGLGPGTWQIPRNLDLGQCAYLDIGDIPSAAAWGTLSITDIIPNGVSFADYTLIANDIGNILFLAGENHTITIPIFQYSEEMDQNIFTIKNISEVQNSVMTIIDTLGRVITKLFLNDCGIFRIDNTHQQVEIISLYRYALAGTLERVNMLGNEGVLDGTTCNIDFSLANIAAGTVTADQEFTFSTTAPVGFCSSLTLWLTNGGAFITTFPSNVKWADSGVSPDLTINGLDKLVFDTIDGGLNYIGKLAEKDPKVVI